MLKIKQLKRTVNYDYSDIKAIKARLKRSFNEGAGSIMSLRGNYFSIPRMAVRSDAECIREDWNNVGRNLRYAMHKVR